MRFAHFLTLNCDDNDSTEADSFAHLAILPHSSSTPPGFGTTAFPEADVLAAAFLEKRFASANARTAALLSLPPLAMAIVQWADRELRAAVAHAVVQRKSLNRS